MDQTSPPIQPMELRPVARTRGEVTAEPRALATLAAYVGLALLILGAVALQTFHFRDRNYRQDEIITAHAGTVLSPGEVVQWMAFDIHPPLWRVAATQWVAHFGQDEHITRFFSTLLTALTLAFVFRLAADLFDRRVGLLAVFVLGTLAYFQFYAHEFRPYPALMMFSTASLWALSRWIRRPNGLYAAAYVLAALATMYTHYFGIFVVACQLLLFLVMARSRFPRYRRFVGLMVAIGIGYLPWLPVLLHTALIERPGGVTYAYEQTSEGLQKIYEAMTLRPDGIGLLLIGVAVVAPGLLRPNPPRRAGSRHDLPFRFGARWPKLYLLVFALVMIALTAAANERLSILTRRNLSPLAPVLAVIAGLGLAMMPGRVRWVAAAIILIPALVSPVSLESNAPYREVVQAIKPDFNSQDRIILHVGSGWWLSEVARNYLADRLPIPDPAAVIIRVEDPLPADESQRAAAIEARLDGAPQVWFFGAGSPTDTGRLYQQVMARDYALAARHTLTNPTFAGTYYLDHYVRIPEPRSNLSFGGTFELVSWRLLTPVAALPCDAVTVEHWWRATTAPRDNYNTSLDIVDSSGVGIARTNGEPAGVLTLLWEPERLYVDTRSVQIPCDTPPGDYSIMVTMYNYNAEPLTARLSDGTALGGIAYLTTIHVGA